MTGEAGAWVLACAGDPDASTPGLATGEAGRVQEADYGLRSGHLQGTWFKVPGSWWLQSSSRGQVHTLTSGTLLHDIQVSGGPLRCPLVLYLGGQIVCVALHAFPTVWVLRL